METASQNISPLYTQEIAGQAVGFPGSCRQILFPEQEYLKLKWKVGYWKSLYKRAKEREEQLKQELLEKEGKIRDLNKRLFGKSSEKNNSSDKKGNFKPPKSGRPRGQQPGSKGHGNTPRPNISEKDEYIDLPAEKKICPKCGKAYAPNGTEDSSIFEVEVKAYKRRNKRKCYKKTCSCEGVPCFISAPPAKRVIPKSSYGNSIWEGVLLNKFLYSQPTNRLLNSYNELGLPISSGTITGGLQKLMILFKPVYDALYKQQMTEDRFHNDESGWKVFESIDGKVGNRWWLWLCRSSSVIFFQIAPGRGTDVPLKHFEHIQSDKIIVVCDRYSAYKSLAKQLSFIILAFCWAHVRRDFLDAICKYPKLEKWAFMWVEMIGELYHINNLRCNYFDKKLPIKCQSEEFKKNHDDLVDKMNQMTEKRNEFLNRDFSNADVLQKTKQKILTRLKTHWEGLSVFVEHPEVPMDNNSGERPIRNPVTGRKNFYGSGSLWSSELAAMMFSIFQTLKLWNLNCNHWLRLYFEACANNDGKVPCDLSSFLPWKMDQDRLHKLGKPPDSS
jgi:transposase